MRLPFVALLTIVLALAGARLAAAETFDCGQPKSPLGRLICGDATLRAADAEENAVYGATLLASLDRAALREEERAWFDHEILPYNWFAQQQAPIDHAKVVEAYGQRSAALRQEAANWRKLRHGMPGTTLAKTCLPLPQRSGDCVVTAFAPIDGAPALRFQREAYAQPTTASVIIIYAPIPDSSDEWLPLALASSDHPLTPPQAVASPVGTLLVIAGSGDDGAAALYRLDKDALQDIDDRSWLETLRSRLPDGLTLSSEVVADYGKMQATAKVTRSQSTCCPAGSSATINLTIEDDRVAVGGVSFGEPSGSPNDRAN